MPYQMSWEIPQSVLCLQLRDDVTFQEFVEFNGSINHHLSTVDANDGIALIVNLDAATSVPQAFNQLKASQTYATESNSRLKYILVVCSGNKLMRLMMLLTFNLCSPNLEFFDTQMDALAYVANTQRRKRSSVYKSS